MRRLWVAIFVVLALGGAATADQLRPARVPLPAPDTPPSAGGVWACPFLKTSGGSAWLHLVNAGRDPASVRITYIPDGRKPVSQELSVGAGRATTVTVPQSIRQAAGAIVEYAGGDVFVSRTAFLASTPASGSATSGGVAAACARPGGAVTVIPQSSTLGADTQAVLLNPGSADASVDVVLLAAGDRLEPETLRRRVVPAHGRLVLRAGDFVFDEKALAIVVAARSGRVVAEGLFLAPKFVEIIPGVAPMSEMVALASTERGAATLAAVAIGDADAIADGRLLTTAGQGAFDPLTAGLPPNTPQIAGAPPGTPAGAVAIAVKTSTTPIAVGGRWQLTGKGGVIETAASSGSVPSHRAVAVIGPPADTSRLHLLVANPDDQPAILDVDLVTESGTISPASLQGVQVEGGRTATLGLSGPGSAATVGVVVKARGGRVVAMVEAFGVRPEGFGAYAVQAVPSTLPPVVAVEPDPRTGLLIS